VTEGRTCESGSVMGIAFDREPEEVKLGDDSLPIQNIKTEQGVDTSASALIYSRPTATSATGGRPGACSR
jgi:hypothetical protein